MSKKLKPLIIAGWIFFISLIAGRTIAIISTHDDVTNFWDFFDRLAIWEYFYAVIFLSLIIGTIAAFKRQQKS